MSPSLNGCTLFDESDRPLPALSRLLQIVGMDTTDADLAAINTWAQRNLLRRQERWDKQTDHYESLRAELLPLFDACGITRAAYPDGARYEGALIHGSLLGTTRLRLNFLIDQWSKGIRFPRLYFLTGDRPLAPGIETFDEAAPDIHTECEMIRELWKRADVPQDMRDAVEVHFIRVPMHTDPQTGKARRPTTDDTVFAWVETDPADGRYLAVSNAPYICRQDLVMQTLAPQYSYDAVGCGCNPHERIVILLDELARLIYQVNINRSSRP